MAGSEIRSVGPYILEGTLGRGQTGTNQSMISRALSVILYFHLLLQLV